MKSMMLDYDQPLYRPPSEANSLIFQVTLGCSFNECSFCDMYRSKEYVERPWYQVKMEIDLASQQIPETKRIFLADGDALNLSTEYMIKILEYLHLKFPEIERISCYAMPMNLLKKKLLFDKPVEEKISKKKSLALKLGQSLKSFVSSSRMDIVETNPPSGFLNPKSHFNVRSGVSLNK